MKTLRHYLIRHGVLKVSSIAESRAIFTFPYAVPERKQQPIWVGRHIEKMSGKYLV